MGVLTYTLCKEYCDLTLKFMAQLMLTVVRSNLHKKISFLLSNVSVIICKTGKRIGVESNKFIHFNPIPHDRRIFLPLWAFKDISICETFFLPKLPCKLVLRMYLYF